MTVEIFFYNSVLSFLETQGNLLVDLMKSFVLSINSWNSEFFFRTLRIMRLFQVSFLVVKGIQTLCE